MGTVIGSSAQFAGKDAAQVVLPHFQALKRAALGIDLEGFPFPKLSFILRVDGEVRSFGLEGAANVDVDKAGAYVSVDIGITITDRARLCDLGDDNPITRGVLDAIPLLASVQDKRLEGVTSESLEASLRSLCDRYLAEVAGSLSTTSTGS
jgi:hypothetical protein